MATVFLLARAKCSSSSCSLSQSQSPPLTPSPWSLEVPEAAMTLLENLPYPVAVVSYLSCDQEVSGALWAAFKEAYGWQLQSQGSGEATRLELGVWAWISGPDPSIEEDYEGDSSRVRKLHLLLGGDDYDGEDNSDDGSTAEQDKGGEKEKKSLNGDLKGLEAMVCPLLAMCSTYLTVVSAGLDATRTELERLVALVQPLVGDCKGGRSARERAVLDWRWVGLDVEDHESDDWRGDGRSVLESVLEDSDDEEGSSRRVLEAVCRTFSDIECRAPISVGVRSSRRCSVVDAIRAEAESSTFRILFDYSVDDNQAEKMCQWVRGLWRSLDSCSGGVGNDGNGDSEYPRVFSGVMLSSRIQACLSQLDTQSQLLLFNTKEMQSTLQDMLRERVLSIGIRTYHQEMNSFLDRRPIPLPWHTLAMVHLRAQSVACEEIEARYCGFGDAGSGGLRWALKDFRRTCVVTETGETVVKEKSEDDDKEELGVKEGGRKVETQEGIVVPGGGLCLEYYSANATALQEYHLNALDDHWQMHLKNRLLGVRNSVGGGTGGVGARVDASASALSKIAPTIKDYTEFLLAVDQVRRGYLESCIPSPEALSVLENLDEMQQSESILFLQTLAAAAPSSNTQITSTSGTNAAATETGTQPQQQQQQPQTASGKGLPSKRYSITNHPTVALNGRELMIHPAAGDDSRITTGGSNNAGSSLSRMNTSAEAPTELEQQIADILSLRRRGRDLREASGIKMRLSVSSHGSKRSAMSLFQGVTTGSTKQGHEINSETRKTTANGEKDALQRKGNDKTVVQFGWTLHLRHANSMQYAWIWDWLSSHPRSSRQNVVACDSKIYTASKWMILPAKNNAGRRKEWQVTYGERVWLVSYWYSTRNAIVELPEYLPRARGGPCGHVVPYGETFVICRTCPADVLCMRCFRASDHAEHSMYLQCSWGNSICVCCDPARLKDENRLHCSLHNVETERAYSALAKGKQCEIAFRTGESVYQCKTCLTGDENDKVLCCRCFHSHNHIGHDVEVRLAEEGSGCSCQDGHSWREDLNCVYHSLGEIGSEYRPRTILPSIDTALSTEHVSTIPSVTQELPHQCGHVFQPGEDIYHCEDCSAHEGVFLCSRCFYGSACVNHQWQMGEFPRREIKHTNGSTGDMLSSVVDGLGISQVSFGASMSSLHAVESSHAEQDEVLEEEGLVVSCGCGDPGLFRKAFDCNYHLPQTFRPAPHLVQCNRLFDRQEVMYRCRTCYVARSGDKSEEIWMCERCFDMADHEDHETETAVNHWNEGLYCCCVDSNIVRKQDPLHSTKIGNPTGMTLCKDDHDRQTALCATDIKDGMFFYQCESCQIDAQLVFCEGCFVREAHEGHSYERLCAPLVGMDSLRCGCGENSAFRFATHCHQHERVGGTNVVLRCQYYARAGEWISLCSDCYPSDGANGSGGYLCQRCRETSDHSGHTIEWVQLEDDMRISCACGSRRRTLPLQRQEGKLMTVGQSSPLTAPALCGYHTMVYKTTPSSTLYLHSSPDHRSSNREEYQEVSGSKYPDSDNDWIIRRASTSSSPSSSFVPGSKGHGEDDQLMRWKDVIWLEHANTGQYFRSMAGCKNGQGFQEVSAGEQVEDGQEGEEGDCEWVVEETAWVRQHILGQ
ncbi:MAG: hypothetical protein J3R72DRAFT_449850 [Linnemannia gamsii]|nr:MAG: hypothetical protein J3R72DRAFT_449850 [Linnemannia gamsii]